ncbi:hypothetical protein [Mastigocoleus sp. MO_188.B34]|nr:hypothetical protein [Mastigocoleus sp. MO_188.B34]
MAVVPSPIGGFHPLAGRCDRKEFTLGSLTVSGFGIPQSTPV